MGQTYLATWFSVGDTVDRCCPWVAGLERVGDERWTQDPDHEIVVVECSQYAACFDSFWDVGGDTECRRHYGGVFVVLDGQRGQ